MRNQVQTVCLVILTTIAVGAALRWLRPVMVPFVLAIFITLGLNLLIESQVRRWRLPRWLALLNTLIVATLGLILLVSLVGTSVSGLAINADSYTEQLLQMLDRWAEALPFDLGSGTSPSEALAAIPVTTVGNLIVNLTNAVLEIVSRSFLVFIFVVFLLLGGQATRPSQYAVLQRIERSISRYLVIKTAVSAATGITVGVILALLGIDLALVFGLFAFLLNYIPNIGSIIATLLPLPMVLVSAEVSTSTAILALALPGSVQLVVGNLIEPKVMGDSLDLHPVVVLLSLILWGTLWGAVGMILATPITAAMQIIFNRLDSTRPMAELLAGRISA